MTKKKDASAGTAIPTLAVETGTPAKMTTTSTQKHTTPAAENQPFRVSDLLQQGAENAISRRDLMSLTGLSDRELRLTIETERRHGTPILSDCIGGYFLPGNQSELDRCVRSLRRRAKEIEATAAAIEQAEV